MEWKLRYEEAINKHKLDMAKLVLRNIQLEKQLKNSCHLTTQRVVKFDITENSYTDSSPSTVYPAKVLIQGNTDSEPESQEDLLTNNNGSGSPGENEWINLTESVSAQYTPEVIDLVSIGDEPHIAYHYPLVHSATSPSVEQAPMDEVIDVATNDDPVDYKRQNFIDLTVEEVYDLIDEEEGSEEGYDSSSTYVPSTSTASVVDVTDKVLRSRLTYPERLTYYHKRNAKRFKPCQKYEADMSTRVIDLTGNDVVLECIAHPIKKEEVIIKKELSWKDSRSAFIQSLDDLFIKHEIKYE